MNRVYLQKWKNLPLQFLVLREHIYVGSERQPSTGLRRTPVTQARRLEKLASDRFRADT